MWQFRRRYYLLPKILFLCTLFSIHKAGEAKSLDSYSFKNPNIVVQLVASKTFNQVQSIDTSNTDTLVSNDSNTNGTNISESIKGIIWHDLAEFIKKNWQGGLVTFLVSFVVQFFLPSVRRGWLRFFRRSYRRYLKQFVSRLNREEDFEVFPNLKLVNKSSNEASEELLLEDIIRINSNVHIQGKPGSGKTSLIKKFVIEYCSKRIFPIRKRIPVYIKYNGENLFDQIISSLDIHELFKNPSLFKKDWLKTQLKKKRFLIIIDDVHNILTDEEKKEKSRIEDLLKYEKTKFILISRDYYLGCPFNFDLFEIKDLSQDREIFEEVLKIHAGEKDINGLMMYFNHGYNQKSMRLYNTPQLLKLFSKVYNSSDRFENSKAMLFEKFFDLRLKEESDQKVKSVPSLLKRRLLTHTALNFFKSESESLYSVQYEVFRKIFFIGFNQIKEEFDYGDYSIEYVENEIFQEGFLINFDGRIQFEHDQWQEYFAAVEILNQRESIDEFLKKGYGREIALFISGYYSFKDYHNKKEFWNNYWVSVVNSDFFLFSECLKEDHNIFGAEDVQDFYKDFEYTQDDLQIAYKELAFQYDKIIRQYFPALIKEFAPKNEEESGVLVEDNQSGIGFWYGYRPITVQNNEKVIVTDQTQIMHLRQSDDPLSNITYYEQKYSTTQMNSFEGISAIHDPPITIAYRDIESQLSEFVRYGNLIETQTMNMEALFIEAVSLTKILQGNRSSISNFSIQEILTFEELLNGIEQLKRDPYLSSLKVPQHDSFGGLERHQVSLLDFELKLNSYLEDKKVDLNNVMVSPNSDLIDVVKKYRFTKKVLTDNDRDYLINRSIQYYKDVYHNYKETIEINFPTSKNSSLLYSGFPISIFLIPKKMKNRSGFGNKLVYYNTKSIGVDISVQIVTEREESEIRNRFQGHQGYRSFWGLDSFNKVEPVRSEVYELIRDEYEKLIKH